MVEKSIYETKSYLDKFSCRYLEDVLSANARCYSVIMPRSGKKNASVRAFYFAQWEDCRNKSFVIQHSTHDIADWKKEHMSRATTSLSTDKVALSVDASMLLFVDYATPVLEQYNSSDYIFRALVTTR